MELRQLRYAEAVARLGSFTRAAEELRVAQPSVSQQVRALERELGAALFDRTTRSVRVTHLGRQFLGAVAPALETLDRARDAMRHSVRYAGESLTIGATRAVGGLDLTGLLTRFQAECPDVLLTLRAGMIADLTAQLESGDLDLVIGPIYPQQIPPTLQGCPLLHDELVLVLGPRTAARVAGLKDAADEPFICLPPGSGLRQLLDLAARAHGIRPRVGLEASTPQDIRALVAADLGVAVLARSVATAPGPNVVVRPLDPAPPYPAIGLLTRRRPAPTGPTRAFADLLHRLTDGQLEPGRPGVADGKARSS